MYIMILLLLSMSHLSIIAFEQELTPITPRPEEISRSVTPSECHTVTVHKRITRSASFSSATTASRSLTTTSEPASPVSMYELSHTPPTIPLKTESPKNAIVIRVSPSSRSAQSLFPSGYGVNQGDTIPTIDIDDDTSLSCRCFSLCACCITGTFALVVLAAIKLTSQLS